MKIAIFTSGSLPVPAVQGGAIENLVDFLLEYNESRKLHDITVYSILPTVSLPLNVQTTNNHYVFVDTHSFWARLKRWLYALRHKNSFYYNYYIEYYLHESLKHFRKRNFDVVILESRPGYAPAIKACSDSRIIVHLHNDWMSDAESPKLQNARRAIDKVITVSDYIRGQVNLIPDGIPAVTVHNGIDLTHFYASHPIDRTLLGFQQDDVVLVYSGRINKEKGISELIDAFLRLMSNDRIKLLILGSSFFGPDSSTDSFVEHLKQKASKAGNRIVFTGYVPYEKVPFYLKASDIAVIPSIWDDPFPTTVLEAMACGLPIVATKSGGIPESAGPMNLLLDRNEMLVDNLYSSICRLIDDQDLRRKIGLHNIERSHLYNKEDYAKRFFDALKS